MTVVAIATIVAVLGLLQVAIHYDEKNARENGRGWW